MTNEEIKRKFEKLENYDEDNFSAYQDGYYDGQQSGIYLGCMGLRSMLIKEYHLLPTTLGYTEQLIDSCIQSIIQKYSETRNI